MALAQDHWGINGAFRVQSNGEWAQTNDRFHDEAVTVSTWTITTTCTGPFDCTGQVHSDQGWSAPIYKKAVSWYVKRSLPNWQQCADGTSADGQQVYRFNAVGPDGLGDEHSDVYSGFDETTGPSGACGVNKPLQIHIPLKLTPVSR